ncbi:MAG: DUF512 domain-containing protein [Peptostreptococcaceae bacterium]|nr:DUF512 domain-containing protein [Peptostreptococcaceae bacterium]
MELNAVEFKNKIVCVQSGSIAEELEIEPGDLLLSVNGQKIEDVIEYNYLMADHYVEVEIEKKDKEVILFEIDKEIDEDIGIEFQNPIIDSVRSCRNKCIFCFIDQLPTGMRKTLYFKDDDSRLSFLQGNFITMTNMGDREIQKMIDYRISPVNISVHTTNPQLRVRMLGNRFAGDILGKIRRLSAAKIHMNAQIVLVPKVNDKEELERTLRDLAREYPSMNSAAVVPIGVTKYREGLFPVEIFDRQGAASVISQVHLLQEEFLETLGSRFVFLSDEFYVTANLPRPSEEAYEGYIQLENGVGLMTKMEKEFHSALAKMRGRETVSRELSIATGASAFHFIQNLADILMKRFNGLKIRVYLIENEFFGRTITVSGLLTAGDILRQLREREIGEELLLSRSMMKADEDIFLDNMSLREFEQNLGRRVRIVESDGEAFIRSVIGKDLPENKAGKRKKLQ